MRHLLLNWIEFIFERVHTSETFAIFPSFGTDGMGHARVDLMTQIPGTGGHRRKQRKPFKVGHCSPALGSPMTVILGACRPLNRSRKAISSSVGLGNAVLTALIAVRHDSAS